MRNEPVYMSAEALGISEEVRQGLVVLARDLADGTVPPEKFNMREWCGTACCIGGHLFERGVPIRSLSWYCGNDDALTPLFFPSVLESSAYKCRNPQQGAKAVVNFLVTGSPKWHDVVLDS